MYLKYPTRLFVLLFIILINSCKHKPDPIVTQSGTIISSLAYQPNTITTVKGTSISSSSPTYSGDQAINFALRSVPNHNGFISINKQGIINSSPELPEGEYIITVIAQNSAGNATFENVFTLKVRTDAIAPTVYNYNVDTLKVNEFGTASTNNITIDGTGPYTFEIVTSPSTDKITIDANGKISVTSGIAIDNYEVTIMATNTLGKTTLEKPFIIKVLAAPASNLTYETNSMSLVTGTTGSSVTPTVEGSNGITYAITTNPTTSEITINNTTGVISASSSLALGSYDISVICNNAAGNITFSNIYQITVTATAQTPSNLTYSPSSITIDQGNSGSSSSPTIQGTTPITYSISSGGASGISINSTTGVISISNSTNPGNYNIGITAINSAGSTVFNNCFSIIINAAQMASSLNYSISSTTIAQGNTATSVQPTTNATAPYTFAIASGGGTGISIDANTGVISTNNTTTVGTYNLNINVSNIAGTQTFNSAYTITVTVPKISFNNDILPIVNANCGNCHTTAGQTHYNVYNNTKNDISLILDRIQRASNQQGFMPKNGAALSPSQINTFKQWEADGFQP